jgi:hypothetical protein
MKYFNKEKAQHVLAPAVRNSPRVHPIVTARTATTICFGAISAVRATAVPGALSRGDSRLVVGLSARSSTASVHNEFFHVPP